MGGIMDAIGDFFAGGADEAAEEAGRIQAKAYGKVGKEVGKYEEAALGDINAAQAGALGEITGGERAALTNLADAGRVYAPYAQAGSAAIREQMALQGLLGPEEQAAARARFTTSPGYDFRLKEGIGALDKSATARGGIYSGAAMKALNDYAQGQAAQEYGSYYDRFNPLTSAGLNAAGGQANVATNRANVGTSAATQRAETLLGSSGNRVNVRNNALTGRTNAITGKANATAGGIIGAANARSQGISNALQLAGTIGGYMFKGMGGSGGGGVPISSATGPSSISGSGAYVPGFDTTTFMF